MQTKFKIIVCGIIGLFLLSAIFAYADDDRNPTASSYLFFLYYDNGQLFADRDFQFKYDVVPEEFKSEILNTQFPYKGEIINLKNQTTATFQFDPRRGDPNFKKGKISVKGPYFADGQKVNFYNSENRQLLSIFVSDSSFCDDNGICNADRGEDTKTCPNDCKATPAPIALPEESGITGGKTGLVQWFIYALIIIVLAGGGYWYWRKKKAASNQFLGQFPSVPPSLPPLPPNAIQ